MKKTIVSCTIALCGVICAVGYLIACSCGNGAMSTPTSYLQTDEIIVIAIFAITALVGLIVAIKDTKE